MVRIKLQTLARAMVLGGMLYLQAPGLMAANLPAGMSQGNSVEGITEYRLSNGLRVLLMPDQSKPTVTVNMTYLVGSRHENYGETGMAHLLEHLLFKGTPKNPQIDVEFNKRGMRINGTTSLDRTNYFELFQASDDNLKWAIELEADRMVNSFIAKKDLDAEMTVVRNEYERGENAPGNVLMKRMQSVMFDWHNYGKSTIGNRSDIENVKIENLQAFYRQYYQPDNAVLMVAGKFEADKVLPWIHAAFSKIPKPKRELPKLWTVEPSQDGERQFIVRRKGDIQLLMVAYKIPGSLHADRDALEFANTILTSAPHGRLHKQLVETGKLVQVFSGTLGKVDAGMLYLGAAVKKGESLEAARDALIAAVEDFKKQPPSAEEIARVKRDEDNYFEKMLNNHESLGISISEYIALGDWRYLFKERDDNGKVSAEQVTQAVNRYLVRDNRTVGMFVPEDQPQRAEVPASPAMAEVMKDFKAKASQLQAEAFDPSPANIGKRSVLSQIGNVKLALLQKQSRGDTVNVALNLHWGDETSLKGKRAIASLTSSLLATGTSKYSRAQLSDEMSKLKMSGSLFNFQTTKANLPEALKLVAHVLKEANFPESEFKQAKERILVNLEASRNEPAAVAGRALAQHFNTWPAGDYRAASSLEDSIAEYKAVQLSDVQAYHKAFYGVSQAELAVVGSFDADQLKKDVQQYFVGWPSATGYQRLAARYDDIKAVRKQFHTPDKENAVFSARLNLSLRDSDADYTALMVANYMFGGGAGMNSRLMERIRQKDGLSYGGSSSLGAGDIDANGSFSVGATAAPQNMAKLEAAIMEELQKSLKQGFTAEELAKAKSGLLQKRLQSRSSDGAVAGGWIDYLYLKRDWNWSQQQDEKIKALTLEQVNQAWQRYIQLDKLSVFIALDENKAKASQP